MVRAHLPKHRGAVHTGSFQSHNKPQDSYLVYLKPYLPKKSNLKAVDAVGNCQRLAFTVGVSQHMHKITNL